MYQESKSDFDGSKDSPDCWPLQVLAKWTKTINNYEDENNQMRLVQSVEVLHKKFYGKRTHSQAFPQREQERFQINDRVEVEWSETVGGDDRW